MFIRFHFFFLMQKYSYRILIFLISVLLSGSAYADSGMTATIHSIPGYGTWDNPASWSEERIPTSDDIVEINGTMAMNVSPTIAGLVING